MIVNTAQKTIAKADSKSIIGKKALPITSVSRPRSASALAFGRITFERKQKEIVEAIRHAIKASQVARECAAQPGRCGSVMHSVRAS